MSAYNSYTPKGYYLPYLDGTDQFHCFLITSIEEETNEPKECWCSVRLDSEGTTLRICKGLVGSHDKTGAVPRGSKKIEKPMNVSAYEEDLTTNQIKEMYADLVNELRNTGTELTVEEYLELQRGNYSERLRTDFDDLLL